MECRVCGGRQVWSRATYIASRRGFHLTVDDVPAWVCEQCGDSHFDEVAFEAIQRRLDGLALELTGAATELAA
jgi:YgiT-type zinc finger domain-containing protein